MIQSLLLLVAGRPQGVQLWRRGRALFPTVVSWARNGVPTATVPSRHGRMDLPRHEARKRARVSVCLARAQYIMSCQQAAASERDVWSTNHSTRVHGDYFATLYDD